MVFWKLQYVVCVSGERKERTREAVKELHESWRKLYFFLQAYRASLGPPGKSPRHVKPRRKLRTSRDDEFRNESHFFIDISDELLEFDDFRVRNVHVSFPLHVFFLGGAETCGCNFRLSDK